MPPVTLTETVVDVGRLLPSEAGGDRGRRRPRPLYAASPRVERERAPPDWVGRAMLACNQGVAKRFGLTRTLWELPPGSARRSSRSRRRSSRCQRSSRCRTYRVLVVAVLHDIAGWGGCGRLRLPPDDDLRGAGRHEQSVHLGRNGAIGASIRGGQTQCSPFEGASRCRPVLGRVAG